MKLIIIINYETKKFEVFIPGPAGRLVVNIIKIQNKNPNAIVLQPHPQYGGTMNNRVVVEIFNAFLENGFSVLRLNFRGVGKSDGTFDNGQGELRMLLQLLIGSKEKIKILVSVGYQDFLLDP